MARKATLSDALLGRISASAGGGRVRVRDSRIPGLIVEVSARHKRLVVRSRGHYRTLGHWPIVSVEEARAAALEFLRELVRERGRYAAPGTSSSGPISGRSRPTLEATLGEYAGVKRIKPRTALDYRQCLERYWLDYLEQPLTALTADAVLIRFRSIPSPAQANYSLRILRALFRFHNAAHEDALPVPTSKAFALDGAHDIKPRSRLILDDQQREWYLSVKLNAGPTAGDLFIFLACTGLRLGEALSLGTNDKAPATAAIQALETKNGRDHALPLGKRMAALLEARKGHSEGTPERVFPINQRNVRKAVARTVEASSIAWSCHDLRRGFVSLATRLNVPDRIVKRLVNHTERDVTGRHYIHLSLDTLRPYMQAIEDALFALWEGGGQPPERPP